MSPQKEISKKITEKNTKQELWQAYNELFQQISKEPLKIQLEKNEIVPSDSLKNLAELKLKISQQLDIAGVELLKTLNSIFDTKNTIDREKRHLIEHFEDQQKLLENEIESVKTQWEKQKQLRNQQIEEEFRQKRFEKMRQENEYDYKLEIKRRQENDEANQNKITQEKKLKEREEIIISKEQEIAKKEIKISQEVNLIKETVSIELNTKHNSELHEIKLDFERDKKIYELKIANLESQIKTQMAEIVKLERFYTQASEQVKEMAVSVIENRTGKTTNQEEDKEK